MKVYMDPDTCYNIVRRLEKEGKWQESLDFRRDNYMGNDPKTKIIEIIVDATKKGDAFRSGMEEYSKKLEDHTINWSQWFAKAREVNLEVYGRYY